MKLFFSIIFWSCFVTAQPVWCQVKTVDKVQFFAEETPLNVTMEGYWAKLVKTKNKIGQVTPARFITKLSDSTAVNEPVKIEVRGHFRRDYCSMPPLKLSFKKSDSSKMYPLKSLKLVNACRSSTAYQQYLLKEYLIYKMYNLLTDKSFRVRFINVEYADSSGKKSEFTGQAFLIEDIKEMSKRNNCIEWNKGKIMTESTERKQMTMVAVFEYMIGNTDWSVPANHNIKLIQSKEDSMSSPFSVPYDFDYSGLVNTDYAIPDPLLNTETVQQRVYRGFARTMDELNEVLDVFKKQKDKIYALINDFNLLTPGSKKNMTKYLDEFFEILNKPKDVKSVFIDNARNE